MDEIMTCDCGVKHRLQTPAAGYELTCECGRQYRVHTSWRPVTYVIRVSDFVQVPAVAVPSVPAQLRSRLENKGDKV